MTKKIKVIQVRSRIGAKKNQISCLIGLGLRKINSFSVLDNSPEVRGMLRRVNHLVRIEKID